MIKTLTNTLETFAPIIIKIISIGKAPTKIGIEIKTKINIKANRIECIQHLKACSISSSKNEVCTDIINISNRKRGLRCLMIIKKPIWPWTSADPRVINKAQALLSKATLPLSLIRVGV